MDPLPGIERESHERKSYTLLTYVTTETIRKIRSVLLRLLIQRISRNLCKAFDRRTIMDIARAVTSHIPVSNREHKVLKFDI